MPNRFVTVIVRCEDLQQRVFFYRLLREKGIHPRTIDIQHCPRGRGDAMQWVKSEHVREVAQLRKRAHLMRGVLTIADADNLAVKDRKSQLDAALVADGQKPRQLNEPIALVIPRRQIETWILFLRGEEVDEEQQCPHFTGKESGCAPEAKKFAQKCPGGMSKQDLPSLHDGCGELNRLLKHQNKDRNK